jgi:formylglycine-generating enzyme required for sulfatase activity
LDRRVQVTNAQFETFGGEAGQSSNWTEGNRPYERISWTESEAFCNLRGARLPTEAEWEYAARGPDNLVYPWGDDFVADNVVYGSNSDSRTWDAGSKPGGVSWVGAYDLSGNVLEWVNDWYDSDYYASSPESNPQGPDTGDYRVLRGGSWTGSKLHVRAADRDRINPSLVSSDFGFRCALSYSP